MSNSTVEPNASVGGDWPWPGVSVIIPTIGRADLARAISSARGQDYDGEIEIIVIVDRPESGFDAGLIEGADTILYTGGGMGAGAARNLGIGRASHPYIALLDDDDEWLPCKLRNQMPIFRSHRADVVGTQAVYRNSNTRTTSSPVPTVVKRDDQTFVEYLFRGRSATVGRAVIFGVTLVVRTELARRIPWDASLPRHQDWDWLDRMERTGAVIIQIPDVSAVVWTGSRGSISSRADWQASLEWTLTRKGVWEPALLADVLTGQALRYAVQARSFKGISRTLQAVAATRHLPSLPTVVLALGGLVPRSLINRMMSRG